MGPKKYTIYMDNAIHGHHGNGKEIHVNQTLQSQKYNGTKPIIIREGVNYNGD